MALHKVKQNDTDPWNFTLKDANGAVDLTGATVVVYMQDTNGNNKVDGASTTITDAANGKVKWEPAATDFDTLGLFKLELEVTDSAGDVSTFPNDGYEDILVLDDLG